MRAAENDAGDKVVEGYAAVFDEPTELWPGMWEVIRPGAFKRTLGHGADVRMLFNHDPNIVLDRTRNGRLELWEDARGLGYRGHIDPEDTEAMNLYRRIKRGIVDQSSFAFAVEQTGETFGEYQGDGDLREILRVKLFDVSPVTYPAYQNTEVQARAVLAFRNAPKKSEDEEPEGDGDSPEPALHLLRNRNRQRLAEIAVRRLVR